jgi:hypothetical protein
MRFTPYFRMCYSSDDENHDRRSMILIDLEKNYQFYFMSKFFFLIVNLTLKKLYLKK